MRVPLCRLPLLGDRCRSLHEVSCNAAFRLVKVVYGTTAIQSTGHSSERTNTLLCISERPLNMSAGDVVGFRGDFGCVTPSRNSKSGRYAGIGRQPKNGALLAQKLAMTSQPCTACSRLQSRVKGLWPIYANGCSRILIQLMQLSKPRAPQWVYFTVPLC